jgi:hypothetical protein
MSDQKSSGWTLRLSAPLLGALCLAWFSNEWQLRTLRVELQPQIHLKMEEYRLPEAEAGRMGAIVSVEKPYVFFGPPTAKVRVYVERILGPDTEPGIHEYDFDFARTAGGTWTQTDSGYCASADCVADGREVLAAVDKML